MENPNHPNDPNVPEGEQAPAAPDGFAPQWIGKHDPNNNNGWIEWDVPLGGEVGEPMVDPKVNEEVGGPSTAVVEGPSSPLPAPRLHVPPTVIENLSTHLGNLEYRHGVLTRKIEEVSDAEVVDSIAIGEIHPRVATVGEQVQVMGSQTGQIVSRLKEIETRVQQVESRVDTHPSGQMAVRDRIGSQDRLWDPSGHFRSFLTFPIRIYVDSCFRNLESQCGGEVDEPMVDPEVNEEVMDDDDFEDDVECLMAPVTPPRATMTVSSTYEVGGPSTAAIKGPSFSLPAPGLPVPPTVIEDLSTRLGNLEYRHGVLLRKMEEVSDAEVADSIAIGEIHPRVATVREQVQVMESQVGQVVSRLKEIETKVQQVESRVDPHPSGQMAVQGQDVIVGLSQQERLTVLEKRLLGPPPGPQKNHAMSEIVTPRFSFKNFTLRQNLPKQNACTLTIDHPARNPFRFKYLRKDSYWSSQYKLLPSLSLSLTLKPFRVFLIDDVTLAKSGEESVNHGTHVT
uniref:Uncharacterized protein n=1 Tax=Tanacetum cinerariifolium TaxID=118510 RepID=A0A699I4D7_TANCI|nr:hypothetical protein [Tanacetum cinerariifolium]